MNAQEIFETVARHLFAQGRPAYDLSDGCLYRGPNGTKCAVGCLIPDDRYDPAMEHHAVQDLSREAFNLPEIKDHEDLLASLQNVHDASSNCIDHDRTKGFDPEKLRWALIHVAKTYELNASFVPTLTIGA